MLVAGAGIRTPVSYHPYAVVGLWL